MSRPGSSPPPERELSDIDLSIVIPAYNEEARLPRSFDTLIRHMAEDGRRFEVVIVDDGSKDRTHDLALSSARPYGDQVRVLRQPANRGKGAAVRRGVAESRGAKVLIIDADLSTPMSQLPKLEHHHRPAALTIGSRAEAAAEITKSQPLFRVMIGRIFNGLAQLMAVWGISDTQCGFKLLDGDVARELLPQVITDGFAYDVELLWLARKKQLQITEVGVIWHDDNRSTVRPWIDGPAMLWEIVRFRAYHFVRSSGALRKAGSTITASFTVFG